MKPKLGETTRPINIAPHTTTVDTSYQIFEGGEAVLVQKAGRRDFSLKLREPQRFTAEVFTATQHERPNGIAIESLGGSIELGIDHSVRISLGEKPVLNILGPQSSDPFWENDPVLV